MLWIARLQYLKDVRRIVKMKYTQSRMPGQSIPLIDQNEIRFN